MNNHMYEHPATQANLDDAARARRHGARARRRRARLARASGASAACPSRPSCCAAVEAARAGAAAPAGRAARARHRRRHARADRRRALRRQPLARAGWASRWPRRPRAAAPTVTVVAANVALPRARGVDYVDVETAAELADAPASASSPAADVLLMAAAVADYRPADAARRQAQEGPDATALDAARSSAPTDVLAALAAARRPGQMLVGFAAEHGDGARRATARDKLARKGLDAVVVNDISRAGIGFDAADNEVTIVTADGEQPRAAGLEGARSPRAILDAVLSRRSSPDVKVRR